MCVFFCFFELLCSRVFGTNAKHAREITRRSNARKIKWSPLPGSLWASKRTTTMTRRRKQRRTTKTMTTKTDEDGRHLEGATRGARSFFVCHLRDRRFPGRLDDDVGGKRNEHKRGTTHATHARNRTAHVRASRL